MFPFEQSAQQMKGVTPDEIEWMNENDTPMGTGISRLWIVCIIELVESVLGIAFSMMKAEQLT